MAPHIEVILKEIDLLQPADLEVLYLELAKRMHKRNKTIAILNKYAGKGKGVWQTDAQHYIHQLRENDRCAPNFGSDCVRMSRIFNE